MGTMIAGIILAAGQSSRLGQPKQLLPFRGRPLLQGAIETMHAAGVETIYVVLGHAAETIQQAIDLSAVTVVYNPHYAEGLSSSLRVGLAALESQTTSVLLTVGDQPLLQPDILQRLVSTAAESGCALVATDYGSYTGTPMVLGREIWPLAASIEGDKGARVLLSLYQGPLATVSVAGTLGADIDTWDDYRALMTT